MAKFSMRRDDDDVEDEEATNSGPMSVILSDPDVLDCSICLDPLTVPVFECENGHIACSSCCTKVENKCPSCRAEIGDNRCWAIEKVVESVRVSCCYLKYGCKETVSYCKKREHEEMCIHAPRSCPFSDCNFRGSYRRLPLHMSKEHGDVVKRFRYNSTFGAGIGIDERFVVLQEEREGTLFILSHGHGNTVAIRHIDPSLSKFRYELRVAGSLRFNSLTNCITTGEVSDPPLSDYFLAPGCFYYFDRCLKMDVCIWGKD